MDMEELMMMVFQLCLIAIGLAVTALIVIVVSCACRFLVSWTFG